MTAVTARASDALEQFEAAFKASEFALKVLNNSLVPPSQECVLPIRQAVFDILSNPKAAERINGALREQGCLSGRFSGIWVPTYLPKAGIPEPTVSVREMRPGVFYVRIRSFEAHALSEFSVAVQFLALRKPKAILLDLRFNGGGILGVVVEVASVFAPAAQSPIVSIVNTDGTVRVFRAPARGVLSGTRTVVLINGTSASGAEIVAGALKNWNVATIVGRRSYGKGEWNYVETDLVSGLHVRSFGGPFCIGAAPQCKGIEKEGVEPEFEVSDDDGNEHVELTLGVAQSIAIDQKGFEKLLAKNSKLPGRIMPASSR
jgi:C-terminal processing protease CtpA/Prc